MLGYDDALDAFGVHGIGGIVGALLTGVFATKADHRQQRPGRLDRRQCRADVAADLRHPRHRPLVRRGDVRDPAQIDRGGRRASRRQGSGTRRASISPNMARRCTRITDCPPKRLASAALRFQRAELRRRAPFFCKNWRSLMAMASDRYLGKRLRLHSARFILASILRIRFRTSDPQFEAAWGDAMDTFKTSTDVFFC